MTLLDLKPGDKVTRLISAEKIPMEMVVVKVEDGLIHCNTTSKYGELIGSDRRKQSYWKFDIETGAEVDDDLNWGPKHRITGSFLVVDEA